MEENLTFEQLPNAVSKLTNEVSQLKHLLINRESQDSKQSTKELLNIQEASELLSLSVATLYSKVSKGELPVMKRSKRLYFSRNELFCYLKEGRKKTINEINQEATSFLPKTKKGLSNG